MSLPLAIMGDMLAPRERAKYQGYFLAVFGTTSVLGPVIGGFFAEQSSILGLTGWRWVFLINVPIVVLALVLTVALAPPNMPNPDKAWDVVSTLYARFALSGLTMAIKQAAKTHRKEVSDG